MNSRTEQAPTWSDIKSSTTSQPADLSSLSSISFRSKPSAYLYRTQQHPHEVDQADRSCPSFPLLITWSSVVSVSYVATLVLLAFCPTIITLSQGLPTRKMPSSQQIAILLSVCLLRCFARLISCDIHDHQTIKDIDKSYDTLVDLFESFESFIRQLDIYTRIPSTTAISEVIGKNSG